MSKVLTCEHLSKTYGKEKTALDNIDLSLDFGRIVGCWGPTAAAKRPSSSWRTVCCSPVRASSKSRA